jgi:hypothetical protein
MGDALQFPDRWAPPGGRQVEIHLGNADWSIFKPSGPWLSPRITMVRPSSSIVPHRSCGCPGHRSRTAAARSRDTFLLGKGGDRSEIRRIALGYPSVRTTAPPTRESAAAVANAVAKNAPYADDGQYRRRGGDASEAVSRQTYKSSQAKTQGAQRAMPSFSVRSRAARPVRVAETLAASLVREGLSLGGIRTILFTAWAPTGPNTAFPGLNAMWPCLATAAVILARTRPLTHGLLTNRAMVWIASCRTRCTFVHWTADRLLSTGYGRRPRPDGKARLARGHLCLCWLLYTFVETPLRKRRRRARTVCPSSAYGRYFSQQRLPTAAALSLVGGAVVLTDGLPSAYPADFRPIAAFSKQERIPRSCSGSARPMSRTAATAMRHNRRGRPHSS